MSYAKPIKSSKEFWDHWGCAECGTVLLLPCRHTDGHHPYCTHQPATGYTYHADGEGRWAKMVPVVVYAKQM